MQRCAGFFVSTKADFSDDSELSELKSNTGDGQKGKQICAGYFLTSPKGDAERGKTLTAANCARCHVIGDHNRSGGINSTPSFWIFARKPGIYSGRLRTFDQRRPHLFMEFGVSKTDIENILAYVATLQIQ